jgi:sugar/nucleoside kinase (ribokinase family)
MPFDAAIFGLIVADLVAQPFDLRTPPAPGGLSILKSLQLTTGGNACNTAIAMAKLGMRVATAGLVGADDLGDAMVRRLRTAGVDTSAVFVNEGAQTSASVVAVEADGERVFYHTPGVTKLLDAAAFRQCYPVFKQCRWLQVGYFGLLPSLTPLLPSLLAELKREAPDLKIALDTVNPPGPKAELEPILPHIDLFAPSRSEAAALSGDRDPLRMCVAFRRHLPKGAIIGIKLDAEGCFLQDGHREAFVPAYKVNAIDTTGAGDTWFGGLLTGLLRGMPLERAGQLANRAAADCCTALGASAGVRGYDETVARM